MLSELENGLFNLELEEQNIDITIDILTEVKNYLRIYDECDDEMLCGLIYAADTYITSCVGENFIAFEKAIPLYKLLLKKIVADLYENRSMNIDNSIKRDNITTTILEKLASYGDENV